jgi:hypothetical protein
MGQLLQFMWHERQEPVPHHHLRIGLIRLFTRQLLLALAFRVLGPGQVAVQMPASALDTVPAPPATMSLTKANRPLVFTEYNTCWQAAPPDNG